MRLWIAASILAVAMADAHALPPRGLRPTTKTPGPVGPPRPLTESDQEPVIARRLFFAWGFQPEMPAAKRRAAVFAIWNAADSEPFPDAARQQVEDYIHRHLDVTERFTDEEITRFNAQRGRLPLFDPYGDWAANHIHP